MVTFCERRMAIASPTLLRDDDLLAHSFLFHASLSHQQLMNTQWSRVFDALTSYSSDACMIRILLLKTKYDGMISAYVQTGDAIFFILHEVYEEKSLSVLLN